MSEKKEQKQIIKLKTGNILLIIIIMAIVISVFLSHMFSFGAIDFLKLILGSVLSALVTLIFIGLIYEKWTKDNFIEEIKNIFINEIFFNKSIMRKLNNNTLKSGVLESIRITIGNKMGSVIFKEYLEPYLSNTFSWRTDHNYTVSFSEESQFSFHDLKLNSENYRTVKQHLHYKKNSNISLENKVSIIFCFDYKSLNLVESKENVFFREYIPLVNSDKDKIFKIFDRDENINYFVDSVLNLKVYKHPCNEKYSKNKGEILENVFMEKRKYNNIPYIYIEYNILLNNGISKFLLGLDFVMPYKRTTMNFLITIPELTDTPKIHFIYSKKMKDLQYYLFNDYKPNDKNDYSTNTDNLVSYLPEKWIFPVSGMTIVWNN